METVMYGNTIICSSLTNPSAAHCSGRRPLAEEQPGEDAAGEPDQNLSRERHAAALPSSEPKAERERQVLAVGVLPPLPALDGKVVAETISGPHT